MVDEKIIRQQAVSDGIKHFATGIAVFQDGKILVVRRKSDDDFLPGAWELPGGGVEDGETIKQGAARELLEETGLKIDKVLGMFDGFDYTTPTKLKIRQINYKVTAKPSDIKLTEHDMYKWITFEDLPQLEATKLMADCIGKAFK